MLFPVSYTHLDVYKRQMLNQVLVTKQTGETGKLVSKIMVAEAVALKKECYFAILQAVSYTHLDVYKRQIRS